MTGRTTLAALLALLVAALAGCEGRGEPPAYDREAAWRTLGLEGSEQAHRESLEALDSVVPDPPPVVGEDYRPEFPPDLPFDPAEWETGAPGPSVAVPDAPRGGVLRLGLSRAPPTIRTDGPNANLRELSDMHSLIYESLLGYDVTEERYVPSLATHWQVGADRMTFRYRLDPRARWADGRPVTSDDVQATFEHLRNPDRKDPFTAQFYGEMVEEVRKLDRLTVEVKAREPLWRSQLTISTAMVFPAAYIRMDGDTYLGEWNWRLPPGTGPYELRPGDVKKGRSITLRRRADYWDRDNPDRRGQGNFDEIRWLIIRDEELEYQKFLAGELDVYFVTRAQRWVDELDREPAIRNGWVQRRKVYNRAAQGFGGYCFNMRSAPFDQPRVRQAFARLLNREKLFAKYFYYQYDYEDSYFPGSPGARPGAEPVRYDPESARRLLAEEGWTRRDGEGYLSDEAGTRFPVLTLEYYVPGYERIHAVYQDDLWQQAGIRLELKLIDAPALFKKVGEYKFSLHFASWGGLLFPNPESMWHSKYADRPQTTNLMGFADPRADAIMDAYKREFDGARRRAMLQELDAIFFAAHPYALAWYGPYFRVLYWDRLGHPPEYAERFTQDSNNVLQYWWWDPARGERTGANMARGKPNHPDAPDHQYDPVDQTWWLSHDRPMGEGTE
ncbi:MAG: ABC transporter substrate-binding protein [Planctomycetes bacterium]|nr:ABC transporter substrate-binding protein [Planctomycetota bacterium]